MVSAAEAPCFLIPEPPASSPPTTDAPASCRRSSPRISSQTRGQLALPPPSVGARDCSVLADILAEGEAGACSVSRLDTALLKQDTPAESDRVTFCQGTRWCLTLTQDGAGCWENSCA